MSISKQIRLTSGGNPNHSYSIYYRLPDQSIVAVHTNLLYADFFAGITIPDIPDNAVSLLGRSNHGNCLQKPLFEVPMPVPPSASPSASVSPSTSPSETPSASASPSPSPSSTPDATCAFTYTVTLQ